MKNGTVTREIYKKKLRRYKYKCLKEQKKDKRRIQEIIENEAEMAKHVKLMGNTNSPKVTSFKTPTGLYYPAKEV